MNRPRQSAFTLIELVMVVAIIVVLAALSIPALNMLRDLRAKTQTRALMNQVASAITTYLATWPQFGSASAIGEARLDDPLAFLVRNQIAAGKEPLMEMPRKQLARASAGTFVPADGPADATDLRDGWTANQENVFRFQVETAGTAPRLFSTRVILRSQAVKPDPVPFESQTNHLAFKDDLVLELTVDGGQWRPKRMTGTTATGAWTLIDP